MKPTQVNIQSVKIADDTGVTITYTDQDNAVYTIYGRSINAPNQTDLTSEDNYSYYQNIILGE